MANPASAAGAARRASVEPVAAVPRREAVARGVAVGEVRPRPEVVAEAVRRASPVEQERPARGAFPSSSAREGSSASRQRTMPHP